MDVSVPILISIDVGILFKTETESQYTVLAVLSLQRSSCRCLPNASCWKSDKYGVSVIGTALLAMLRICCKSWGIPKLKLPDFTWAPLCITPWGWRDMDQSIDSVKVSTVAFGAVSPCLCRCRSVQYAWLPCLGELAVRVTIDWHMGTWNWEDFSPCSEWLNMARYRQWLFVCLLETTISLHPFSCSHLLLSVTSV